MPMARPLKTAPGTDSWVCAVVMSGSVGAHADTVPASESKMNRAGVFEPPAQILKALLGLKTWPVGAPLATLNTSGTWLTVMPWVAPAYSVAVPVPLLATQSGVVGPAARPH